MGHHSSDHLIGRPPADLRTDVAVLGSGPGGAITACLIAEAGREVVLIEEGRFLSLESTVPFSSGEMQEKYRNGGITVAMGAPKIAYAEGRCVGGGSEINSGLYHRTPPEVLEGWSKDFTVEALSEVELRPHFEACEAEVHVSYLPGEAPAASLKLHNGAQRLGWRSLEVPRWFRYQESAGPKASPAGAKQSMTETFIPRALKAGCSLLPDARVLRLERRGGCWIVHCEHHPSGDPSPALEVRADTVFVACGAIQTPALLRRSGITRNVGDSLHLHPTVKVVARFDEEINSEGMGVPVHQVKEFAPRFSFGCSISAPPHLALAMTDHPEHLGQVKESWRHMAVYYGMSSGGRGTVRNVPFFRDPLVRFKLEAQHLAELAEALTKLCQCLLTSPGVVLYPSIRASKPLTTEADLATLPRVLPANRTSLMTIHAFSTCPMGENRSRCAVDSFGKVHDVQSLHVADSSLLCGPPGVNPQGSIMAIARRNALRFLQNL